MAKAKFDFKSIEVPAAAQKPLYASVGAGDLAVTAVKEYVADVQKSVSDFDPKSVRDSAFSAAKARRAAIESRVADLQAEALALPTKVQTTVNDNVATVTGTVLGTYGDLAKRGEAVVRGTKLPSTATLEVKVNTTKPSAKKAPVRKPATKKATKPQPVAKKASTPKPAKKTAPAKKAATTAKKTTSTAKKTSAAPAKKAAAAASSTAGTTASAASTTASAATSPSTSAEKA